MDEEEALFALSPLDGRYARDTAALREYFSEWALLRDRLRVELEYLLALTRTLPGMRPPTDGEERTLRELVSRFTTGQAQQVKALERETRHDVKALEYYWRSKLEGTPLADRIPWLHFGLTSEDVTATAQALELRAARDAVLLPALDALRSRLTALAEEHKATPMLARTHGQPAVPTTLGKELAVYLARLRTARAELAAHRFEAKLNGAVGNFNALAAAAPDVDWPAFSADLLNSLGLEPNLVTTQILPFDNWVRYFDALRLTNSILLDLAQDLWRYVGEDYLSLRVVAGEVGSSTLPQKVNPIDFENAEGNLGLANALLAHYAAKLPVSRLQRDLSDSTVRRSFGAAHGHTLLAWLNLRRGLERVQANEARLRQDLDEHPEIVAEGAQTLLRAAGMADAYEWVKELTRGKGLTRAEYERWVEQLPVDEPTKQRLRALTSRSYLGLAEQITERVLAEEKEADSRQ